MIGADQIENKDERGDAKHLVKQVSSMLSSLVPTLCGLNSKSSDKSWRSLLSYFMSGQLERESEEREFCVDIGVFVFTTYMCVLNCG